MNQNEMTKMEFLLTLNENIVVQRFYNVRGYNPKAKNSMDVYDQVYDFTERLQKYLKMRSVDYLLENEYQISEDPQVLETSFTDGPEKFNIFVKIDGDMVHHRQFDAKIYPPKIRYTVDVRFLLKDLLRDLTEIFSSKNLTLDYMGVRLAR
jgi:hypothetical protein